MTVIDLTPRLRVAADYLHKVGWTTGTEKNDAGQVCLTGAIKYCAPQNGDEYLIREVLRGRDRAESWNDGEATAEQVEGYLRTAEVTDADLEETFGPQWLHIVQLVRAASALTAVQAGNLGAAWGAAGAAARGAAWGAAGAAARGAAWDAAWDAAWGAVGGAAWGAVGGAAAGAAVRDLIGQHGFTQAHYDTLTGPWRRVVGRIHPDDAELS